MDKTVRFKLNGKEVAVETSPERMLLWVLRADLAHTGTKYSCGEGYCGSCTVLVDKEAHLAGTGGGLSRPGRPLGAA